MPEPTTCKKYKKTSSYLAMNKTMNKACSDRAKVTLFELFPADSTNKRGDSIEDRLLAALCNSDGESFNCRSSLGEDDAQDATNHASSKRKNEETATCNDSKENPDHAEDDLIDDIPCETVEPSMKGLPFNIVVRQISQGINEDMCWKRSAVDELYKATRNWLTNVLANANDIAIHAGRDFIKTSDVHLVLHLRRCDPFGAVQSGSSANFLDQATRVNIEDD